MHYGKRDFLADGSYITTLWFVVFYLPIYPIKSVRLRATGETKYYSMRRVPVIEEIKQSQVNRTQVMSVYAWFATEFAVLITAKIWESRWMLLPAVIVVGLPFLLRKRAQEKVKAEGERKAMGFSPSLPE